MLSIFNISNIIMIFELFIAYTIGVAKFDYK